MGAEGRQVTESCLSEEQWGQSQKNEAWFWQTQKDCDNIEQYHRNTYYRNVMEDDCIIARDFFAQDFADSAIIDIGSGPHGILHVLDAKFKLAIDPLMSEFIKQGYDVGADNVWWMSAQAEDFHPYTIPGNPVFFDYATCLNAVDHMQEPAKAVENIAEYLDGELLLITDLRTPDKLDDYHRLSITQEDVMEWVEPHFEIIERQNYAHQPGNPLRQLILRCRKI